MKKICLAALALMGGTAVASSHREAPAIAKDPGADLTDVYVFKSEQADHYTFIMNVSPAYVAYGGPNWFGFDDEVLYEMHIDNNGDAVEDVTYQFKFTTSDYRSQTGLIISNFPSISWDDTEKRYVGGLEAVLGADARPALGQTYSVTKVLGGRRSADRAEVLATAPVAPPRIGPQTTDGLANLATNGASARQTAAQTYITYKTLADHAITSPAGSTAKFFAGPRNDPFFVDLGAVFDRVSPRIPTVTGNPRDALRYVNALSIVFEVPNTEVFGAADNNMIGVWATTSRQQAKVLKTNGAAPTLGGGYVQVSRLGNPLVNELVIKVGDKDKFNATNPADDVANFAGYVTDPQLAFVLNALYDDGRGLTAGAGITVDNFVEAITETGRTDLVDVFVAGISGVNRYPDATGTGDMIRVNKALTAGALGITAATGVTVDDATSIEGWPLSGRVLGDDIVNTALTFVSDCKFLAGLAITRAAGIDKKYPLDGIWSNHDVALPVAPALAPANCLLDDFIETPDDTDGNAVATANGILTSFPYIDIPHSSFHDYDTYPNTYP